LVAPDRLRFDFVHDQKVTDEVLQNIETEINNVILANYPVRAEEKSLKQAQQEGAMALFGEKYGERVRTIVIAENGNRYSYELCGGVHVRETAEIGAFVFVSEGSVSAGVRRVEALTGRGAVEYVQNSLNTLGHISGQLGTTPDKVVERVSALQEELFTTKKQVEKMRRELARQSFEAMISKLDTNNGIQSLVAQIDDLPMDTLREMSDWFRGKVKSGVIVLASELEGRPQIVVAVTDDLSKQGWHAGNLIKEIAAVVGGGGGGRPTMAQAGGKDVSKLPDALKLARQLIAKQANT
jgi:alanyl-tRNA synthetase